MPRLILFQNWFNNHNVRARRSQGSMPAAPVSTPTYNDSQESTNHRDTQAAATPTPLNRDLAEFSGTIPKRSYPDDGTPGDPRPAKKTQLEVQSENFKGRQDFNVSWAAVSLTSSTPTDSCSACRWHFESTPII